MKIGLIFVFLVLAFSIAACVPAGKVRGVDIILRVEQIHANPHMPVDKVILLDGKACINEGHVVLMQECDDLERGMVLLKKSDGLLFGCTEECEGFSLSMPYRVKGLWKNDDGYYLIVYSAEERS
ncbi:MAG: hypothetical protein V1659_02975 [Candidatus Woesearchaeota archaeon]